ncbi:methyltransferase [Advenella kashmirensis W13003]|uniref:Protein MgtC n=1 Tax=Advenella kashmirensis W13003 TaxID=1424334 RepID=V8QRG2_9BURK|nr:MgtC/SapB family protein [Advenella kashmirensis]ETF02232.1 methyltransferase [Advenella kashmirensis W13003]
MASEMELVGRLVMSAALGSLIGFERERLSWAAGLRTHMLVCVGSSLMMIVSIYGFTDTLGDHVTLDPSRVAAQVVSGIGFLGAGAILARGQVIRGLTTAASVWSVAGIGLAVGGGLYTPSIAATLIILLILAGVKPLEKRFIAYHRRRHVTIKVKRGKLTLGSFNQALGVSANRVKQFIVQPGEDEEYDEVYVVFSRMSLQEYVLIRKKFNDLPGIESYSEMDSDEEIDPYSW